MNGYCYADKWGKVDSVVFTTEQPLACRNAKPTKLPEYVVQTINGNGPLNGNGQPLNCGDRPIKAVITTNGIVRAVMAIV